VVAKLREVKVKEQLKEYIPKYHKTDQDLLEKIIRKEDERFQRKLKESYREMWKHVNFDEPLAKPFHD